MKTGRPLISGTIKICMLLLGVSQPIWAQQLKGIITDKATKVPVAFASIKNAGQISYSGADGRFSLSRFLPGDTLLITHVGYKAMHLKLSLKALTDTLRISMEQSSFMLNDITIRVNRDFKRDSLRLRKEFGAIFSYHAIGFKDIFITRSPSAYVPYGYNTAQNNTTAILSVDVLSVISMLSKKKAPTSKLQQILIKEEAANYVDQFFSKQRVTALTGLTGDSLQTFIDRYRPSTSAVQKMSAYDMIAFIHKSHAQYVGRKM